MLGVQASEEVYSELSARGPQPWRTQFGPASRQRNLSIGGSANAAVEVSVSTAAERGNARAIWLAPASLAVPMLRTCARGGNRRPIDWRLSGSRRMPHMPRACGPRVLRRCSKVAMRRMPCRRAARATVNCRILPDENPQDIDRITRKGYWRQGSHDSPSSDQPTPSPPSPLTKEVMGVIETRQPRSTSKELASFRRCRRARPMGFMSATPAFPVYGVSAIFFGSQRRAGRTAATSAFRCAGFYDALDFWYDLVRAFAQCTRQSHLCQRDRHGAV